MVVEFMNRIFSLESQYGDSSLPTLGVDLLCALTTTKSEQWRTLQNVNA